MRNDDPGDAAIAVRLCVIGALMALLGVAVVQFPAPWSPLGQAASHAEAGTPMQSDREERPVGAGDD